jgi:hypothetical protein
MVGKLTPDDIISASVVPALLGYSPYMTRNQLLQRCIAAAEGTFVDTFTGNEATFWGNELEPVILKVAAERLGLQNFRDDFPAAFPHPTLRMACSLDGLGEGSGTISTDADRGIFTMNADTIDLTGPVLVESKATRSHPESRPPASRGPLQLQAQMMCTGHQSGVIATLYQGLDLRLFVYAADLEIQRQIAEAVVDFERRKADVDFYPVESSDDAAHAYSTVDQDAPEIDLSKDAEVAEALSDLVEARADKGASEARIDAAQATIMEYMGAHPKAKGLVGNRLYQISRPMRSYSAKPQRVVPAKDAYTMRQKTLTIKEI